ncbi:Protein tesmin/TSO1-like CXC 2 [Acorus gramineus]|uniref:Protein tesmin/TSO1-like CXC 2 n=1 Tax=Acorus gramineus TaxID=55184 RepID=A0AAV9B628_ACOGR|nr:Protein tesmin/TSO1-like CXC 2 [Acorus gramineus]
MDTPPEKTRASVNPVSKIEDSPVFDYLNSLSPIKPVKSMHYAQLIHPLNDNSIPSVFASPHVSVQKESRFFTRCAFSELSKSDISLENGKENSGVGDILQENISTNEHSSAFSTKLTETLRYESGSPDHNTLPLYDVKMESRMDLGDIPLSSARFIGDVSNGSHGLLSSEIRSHGISELELSNGQGNHCDWDNRISDASDLLIFDSSTGSEACRVQDQNLVDQNAECFASLPLILSESQENVDESSQKTQPCGSTLSLVENTIKNPPTNHDKEPGEPDRMDQLAHVLSSVCQDNDEGIVDATGELVDEAMNSTTVDDKVESQHQRGVRRRCLFVEMGTAHKNNLHNGSDSDSSRSVKDDANVTSDDRQLVPFKAGNGSSTCMLPSIGLHLNALATTSKDSRMVLQENPDSGRQSIKMSSSIGSLRFLKVAQTLHIQRDSRSIGGDEVMQDASCTPAIGTDMVLAGANEAEHGEEESDTCEKNGKVESPENDGIQKDGQQYHEGVLPITPSFQVCSSSGKLPFLSGGKPPRSSVFSIGSSKLNSCGMLRKSKILLSAPKFEKHFQIVPEDETPEILKLNASPMNTVKSSSPNS